MEFKAKKIILKDGTECILRSPNENDAKKMIKYLKMTSGETHFMTRYPEEITLTVDEEIKILRENLNSNTNLMIAAFINDDLAGNAAISCIENHIYSTSIRSFAIIDSYFIVGIGQIYIRINLI